MKRKSTELLERKKTLKNTKSQYFGREKRLIHGLEGKNRAETKRKEKGGKEKHKLKEKKRKRRERKRESTDLLERKKP